MDYISEQVLALAAQEEIDRIRRFEDAWKAYEGNAPYPLIVRHNEPNDNVRVNYSRLIVDTGVSFLFGKPVTFAVDQDDSKQDPAEERLDELWTASGGNLMHKKFAKNGAVKGHVVAKLQPTDNGPRVINVDPSNFYPTYDETDIETLERAEIRWLGMYQGKPRPFRQRFEPNGGSWSIVDEVYVTRWQVLGTVEHPFDWMPLFDAQNLPCPNEFWGTSDLEADILALIRSMERVLGRRNRILRLHAHPKPYVVGTDPESMKTLPGDASGAWFFPEETTLGMLEMQSDLQSSQQLYRDLKESLHELSRVPEIATGKTEHADRLAGVALEILYQPLVNKNDDKRGTYGPMLEDISKRMLEMDGIDVARVITRWPKALPVDAQSEAQALETAQRMGVVSDQTIAEKLGLDWATEQARIKTQPEKTTVADALMTNFDRGAPAGTQGP